MPGRIEENLITKWHPNGISQFRMVRLRKANSGRSHETPREASMSLNAPKRPQDPSQNAPRWPQAVPKRAQNVPGTPRRCHKTPSDATRTPDTPRRRGQEDFEQRFRISWLNLDKFWVSVYSDSGALLLPIWTPGQLSSGPEICPRGAQERGIVWVVLFIPFRHGLRTLDFKFLIQGFEPINLFKKSA